MAIQQGKTGSEEHVFISESEPVSRLKSEYRSLRRHVCCVHFMIVFLCLTCCLITVMFQSYASGCKDKDYPGVPAAAEKQTMTYMNNELSSSEKTSPKQNFTPFIRLTTQGVQKEGNVSWKLNRVRDASNGFFTLDGDNKTLIVNHPGTYKFILQITYRGLHGHEYKDSLLHHEIHRYTAAYPKHLPVLMKMETVNFRNSLWKKTLSSEDISSLEEGDRLTVWSETCSLIDVGVSEYNFFAVYPLFCQT